MQVRPLPKQAQRVESGPVQFGDDWPGCFIRGDDAAYYEMLIRSVIDGTGDVAADAVARDQLRGLQEMLAGCMLIPVKP